MDIHPANICPLETNMESHCRFIYAGRKFRRCCWWATPVPLLSFDHCHCHCHCPFLSHCQAWCSGPPKKHFEENTLIDRMSEFSDWTKKIVFGPPILFLQYFSFHDSVTISASIKIWPSSHNFFGEKKKISVIFPVSGFEGQILVVKIKWGDQRTIFFVK